MFIRSFTVLNKLNSYNFLPYRLALALLVTWVDTDHSNRSMTANNLAVPAHLLD